MKLVKHLIVLIFILGCAKEKIPVPEIAQLLAPENNDNCTTAQVIDETQSQVNFQWATALHTDTYILFVENKNTGQQNSYSTTFLTKSIRLSRAATYAWWVVTESEASEMSSKSAVWTFYLEGSAAANSLPYPALLMSPEDDAVVSAGSVNLQWNGRHPEGAPLQYEIYVGNQPNNLIKKAGPQSGNSYSFDVSASSTYYWKIKTIDPEGDFADSAVYSFHTQ